MGNYVTAGVGNYVTRNLPNLGNFVTADRRLVRFVAFPGRLGDPAGEVVDARIVGIEVVRTVVIEEQLPQCRIGQGLGLVVKQVTPGTTGPGTSWTGC
jgi:hypothetical protein